MGIKRALLVGINYPGTDHALRGCVNDVMRMNDIIVNHFGFTDPNNRRILTDASATTDAILERLEWLVKGAKAGDVLFFHYSGHGSQLLNKNYGADQDHEPDGLDEIICPVDLNWRDKVVRDDQMKAIFDKVPAGVNLTVILDCCHSGGGLDQVNQYQTRNFGPPVDDVSPNRERRLVMPYDIFNRTVGLEVEVRPRSVQSQSRNVDKTGLLLSGCRSDQTSADAWIHNQYIGAATFYLTDTLERHNWDVDYKTLIDEAGAALKQYKYSQRPELNGSATLFNQKFLQPLGDVDTEVD